MKPGDHVLYPKFWDGSHPDQFHPAILLEIRDPKALIEVQHLGHPWPVEVTLSLLKPDPNVLPA